MILKKKGSRVIIAVVFSLLVIGGIGWTTADRYFLRCEEGMVVTLGQEFTLGKNCFVRLSTTDLEIGVVGFHNDPCPPDVQCVWSGQAVYFEYRVKGEIKKDLNLSQDYGYRVRVVRSNYESYATLRIEQLESYYPAP